MKKITKEFNYWLREIEKDIEDAREKGLYSLALDYAGQARGYIKIAYFLNIIDKEEHKILHNKFFDYYHYYYDLIFFK